MKYAFQDDSRTLPSLSFTSHFLESGSSWECFVQTEE